MNVKSMLWLLCHTKLDPPKCDVIIFIKHFCILFNIKSWKKWFDNIRLDVFIIQVNYENDN